jgi:acyl-CoA synthetase (AMP-forming)/AMP-acid ligase II
VVYSLATEDTTYHNHGSDNLMSSRYTIGSWAQSADAAAQLADACYDVLSGFRGVVSYGSNSPQSQVMIYGVFLDLGSDDYDNTAKLHVRRRDYFFRFAEY